MNFIDFRVFDFDFGVLFGNNSNIRFILSYDICYEYYAGI